MATQLKPATSREWPDPATTYERILTTNEATTLGFKTARQEVFQRVVDGFAAS